MILENDLKIHVILAAVESAMVSAMASAVVSALVWAVVSAVVSAMAAAVASRFKDQALDAYWLGEFSPKISAVYFE